MSESAILHDCMIALSDAGCCVFRANVGLYYTRDGRPVRTGLPNGFSDLFGFRPDGRAFFVEVKTLDGRVRPGQWQFLRAMRERGAIALVARSAPEAVAGVLRHSDR
jgi:hypothetical protein